MVTRRQLLAAVASGVGAAIGLAAAAGALRRIGLLTIGAQNASGEWTPGITGERFVAGMRALGYSEGTHYRLEVRLWRGQTALCGPLARELVREAVEVIVANGPESIEAARSATKRIPIVMLNSTDPIATGWVKSLARPGGNLTGLTWDVGHEFVLKQLELLKEVLPGMRRLAVLYNDTNPGAAGYFRQLQHAEARLGATTFAVIVNDGDGVEGAFRVIAERGADALLVVTTPVTVAHRNAIMAHALRAKLPVLVVSDFGFPDALLVFGPHVADMPQRAARYVHAIFKGANAGELPIERPNRYDLIVDLTVARKLGITIPRSILLRADQLIE